MSGSERTDGGTREDTAGEGLFEVTDGAIHWPLERTHGRPDVRAVAPPRTLVLARVAAPRRGGDAAKPEAPRALAILDLVHAESCDFLPPPDDGVPTIRPRVAYSVVGATREAEEVTSEVRPPSFVEAVPLLSASATLEPPPVPRAWMHRVRAWVRCVTRGWRR